MIKFLQTPGKTKKIVLGGLLLVICGAMVVTLVPGGMLGEAFGFGVNTAGVVAKVGPESVTTVEVQRLADRIGRQQFPNGAPPTFRPFLMQSAAQQLITQKALLAEADRLGLRITDAEVTDFLRHSQFADQLFPNGTPVAPEQYENFVRQFFNMDTASFEDMLRASLLIQKLSSMIEGGVTVTKAELQQAYTEQNTKVKFDYAVLTNAQILKDIKPTEAELKAYYDSHKQQFVNSIPEKREVKYVLIDTAKLAEQIPVTPEDVQRYYNSHQDQYRVPDQITVRQIQFSLPAPGPDGKVDQKTVDAARAKADEVLKKLKAGGNFEQLAKQYSQDTASKDKGGLIGPIVRGQTDPEFEKAAFSLPKGGTSDIVQDALGFHIIHVDEKQTAHVKPLEEVRPEIEKSLRQEKVSARANDLATRMENQARTMGLDKAAAQNGLQTATSGFVGRTDSLPEVGSAPDLMNAVFEARTNQPPDAVQIAKGWVVYQVAQIKPAATPTFEEAKSQVESQFKNERAGALLAQKTQELSDRARADHDLKKAAAALGATIKTSELVPPSGQVPDIGSMSGPAAVAFTMKPGDISTPINTGRDGVVLQLTEKQEPSPADFDKAKEALRENLLQRKREQTMELFASNLRDRLQKEKKIRINDEEWKRLTGNVEGS